MRNNSELRTLEGSQIKMGIKLVWKGVPEESRAEAAEDRKNNPNTTHDASFDSQGKGENCPFGISTS